MQFICLLRCVSERRETVVVGPASHEVAASPGKPDKSIPYIFKPSDQVFIFPLGAQFETALTRTLMIDQREMLSSMLSHWISF